MKRCQRGTTRYNDANDLHAECYGTIGALVQERDQLREDKLDLAVLVNELISSKKTNETIMRAAAFLKRKNLTAGKLRETQEK